MSEPHVLYAGLRFTYLLADRYQFGRAWVYPESRVPYSLLRYITSGLAEFDLDGVAHEVQAGDVVHIPEGSRLACRATSDEFSFISIRFISSVKLGDADFLTAYFGVPAVTAFGDDPKMRGYFEHILAEAQGDDGAARVFAIRGTLELIVGRLVAAVGVDAPDRRRVLGVGDQLASGVASSMRRDPRIEAVVNQLIHNPSDPVETDQLCRIADVSPSALRRLFKSHTGKTIGEFVTELRMMTAARMLIVTSDRVGEIARSVGFGDQNYFARAFKTTFGMSPRRYRQASREQQ